MSTSALLVLDASSDSHLRQQLSDLQQQVIDISSLCSDYRNKITGLTNELSSYRREPLVQLLWQEIVQVKTALEEAVAAGFTYDAGEPSSRYIDLKHVTNIADINDLEVTKILAADRAINTQTIQQHTNPRTSGLFESRKSRQSEASTAATANVFNPEEIGHKAQQAGDNSSTPTPIAVIEAATGASPASASPGILAASRRNSVPLPPSLVLTDTAIPVAPQVTSASMIPIAPPCAPDAPPPPPGLPMFSQSSAVQPTKPVIQPSKKMKPIHWQRIILPSNKNDSKQKKDVDSCIWDEVSHLPEPPLDVSSLSSLFCDARSARSSLQPGQHMSPVGDEAKEAVVVAFPTSPSPRASQWAKQIRVLSDKRFNAVSIMMTSFPAINIVCTAIRRLDSTILNIDQVSALRKNLPDETEMAALLSISQSQISSLTKPDLFMHQLVSIPQIAGRLDCWHFYLHFNELLDEIKQPLIFIESAINAVKHSRALKQLLCLILTAGNYMNGGTNRGQADGFEITVISRLSTLRDQSGTQSLLLWLMESAHDSLFQGENWLYQLDEQLSPCGPAADYPLRQSVNAAHRFHSLVRTMKNTATLVLSTSSTDPADPFPSIFASFNTTSDHAASQLLQHANKIQTEYSALCQYLHPNQSKHLSSEDLFALLRDVQQLSHELNEEKRISAEEISRQKRMDDAKKAALSLKEQQKALIAEVQERDKKQQTARSH